MDRAAHVVGKVLQANPRLGAGDADAAHQRATHVVGLRAEHVLDPGADFRAGLVALFLALAESAFEKHHGQRLSSVAAAAMRIHVSATAGSCS